MTRTQPGKKSDNKSNRISSRTIWWTVGGVVGLALIVWMAWAIASEGDVDTSVAFGPVTVEGEPLPTVDLSGGDPAVGLQAPTVTGSDASGGEHTIGPDGNPKIVVFLAHWCPHCQREVPLIQSWVDSGGLPDGVDMYSTTVLTNRLRDSSTWPPHQWLASEGWTIPVLRDSQDGDVALAYGLTGTPMYLVLDGENNNLGRISGEIGVEGLNALANLAASSIEG